MRRDETAVAEPDQSTSRDQRHPREPDTRGLDIAPVGVPERRRCRRGPAAKPTSSPTATPIPLPPTGALAANPKTKVKVAGATKVRYFKVAGSTPDELLASVVASSKAMCHSSDTLACVLNSPVVHWTKRTNLSTGRCRISAEYVTLKSVVSLPVWTKPSKVPPGLVTWWQAMLKHFAWHEGQHIKIEKKYDAKLKSLLVGQPCSAAKKIIKKSKRAQDNAPLDRPPTEQVRMRRPYAPGCGGGAYRERWPAGRCRPLAGSSGVAIVALPSSILTEPVMTCPMMVTVIRRAMGRN